MLIDVLKLYLENEQFSSQDKILFCQNLSFQIHFFNKILSYQQTQQ